jgi:hypothetical protein
MKATPEGVRMNFKFPGPCDDVKWGRTDLWDLFEAAHVLVDIEPSTDQDPYFEPEAEALYQQLKMSIALGYPKIAQQIGNRHLFLPLQMIDWALQKGYVVSDDLISEVRSTAKTSIDRWRREKALRETSEPEAVVQTGMSTFAAAHPAGRGLHWRLKKPIRYQGYGKPLYDVLKIAHNAGDDCPTARDVLDAFKVSKPPEVIEIMSDGLKYYDSNGDSKPADIRAIAKAIGRLVEQGADSPE